MVPAPHLVIPAKAGIQRGGAGCGNDARTLPPTNAPNFHTLVCRRQPAWAIAMKTDRSSNLMAIAASPFAASLPSFRPPTSSFRRWKHAPYPDTGPESRRGEEGQDRHTIGKSPAPHHFIFLRGLCKAMVTSTARRIYYRSREKILLPRPRSERIEVCPVPRYGGEAEE